MPSLNIIADEMIVHVREYFSVLGEITQVPAEAITNELILKADVLLVRSKTRINSDLLQGSKVQFIGSTVSGTDHIDFSYLQSTPIQLSVARGCNANSVANYCLLAWCELQHHKGGNMCLFNYPVGIVGYGKTAQKLIDKLLFLGAKVVCYDPPFFTHSGNSLNPGHIEHVQVTHQLADIMQCPLISLHPALHDKAPYSSYQLIDKPYIKYLSKEHTLINTSRGEIVHEQALLSHRKKVPFSWVMDCWQNEPAIHPKLLPYVDIATPHIAGHSLQAKVNGSLYCYRDLLNYLGMMPNDPKHRLSDSAKIMTVDLSECSSKEAIYFKLNQQHYLPSRDQLDDSLNREALSQQFHDYRRDYPIRHEISQHNFHLQNVPKRFTDFVQHIDRILQ